MEGDENRQLAGPEDATFGQAIQLRARMPAMKLRTQLVLIAAAYALVVAVAGAMIFARHMLYVLHPQETAAAGGMYAAGNTFLALIVAGMLMVPTFFLALVARNSERVSTVYARSLLCLSLTAPLSLGLLAIPAIGQGPMILGMVFLERLIASPVLVVAYICSRLLARFPRGKRLTLFALGVELLTFIVVVGWFFFPSAHRG